MYNSVQLSTTMQGRRNIFRSGGAKIQDNKMHAHVAQSIHIRMPNQEGSGGMPPGNFLNLHCLRSKNISGP